MNTFTRTLLSMAIGIAIITWIFACILIVEYVFTFLVINVGIWIMIYVLFGLISLLLAYGIGDAILDARKNNRIIAEMNKRKNVTEFPKNND